MIPLAPSSTSLKLIQPTFLAKSQHAPSEQATKESVSSDVTLQAISETTALLNPSSWWIGTFVAGTILSLLHVWHFTRFPRFYFLPVTIAVCALLVFQFWNRVPKLPSSRSSLGFVLASTFKLLLAIVLGMPWFAGLALILHFAAFCSSHFDRDNNRLTRLVLPALFLVPLPQLIDGWLTESVEQVLSMLGGTILDLAEITHRFVAGTCCFSFGTVDLSLFSQGINSIQAVSFTATLLCIWMGRSTWLLPAYLLSAFAVTVLTNLGQLLVFQYIGASTSFATAEGLSTGVLGVLGLVSSFILLTSFDRLVLIVFSPVEDKSLGRLFYNPIIKAWDSIFGLKQLDPKASQERLFEATLDRSSARARWLLLGSALIMLLSVPIQLWQCYNVLNSQTFVHKDLAKLSKQLSVALPEGWSLTEINEYVSYEPPVLADKAVHCTVDGSNVTLRLALIETNRLDSWILNASRLGWKVRAENDSTLQGDGSLPWNAYALSRDNRQVGLFEVAFAKRNGNGIIDTDASYWLRKIQYEIEHQKYFQLRVTMADAIEQSGGSVDFQQVVQTLCQQIEIAFNVKMQEKQ